MKKRDDNHLKRFPPSAANVLYELRARDRNSAPTRLAGDQRGVVWRHIVFFPLQRGFAFFIVKVAGIEQGGILGANGQGKPVFNGVQIDKIAQDVALYGSNEGVPGRFQAFEQVGTAEAHEPPAGAGQVVQLFLLGRCGLLFQLFGVLDVIAQAVAGKSQVADDVDHVVRIKLCVLVVGVVVVDAKTQRAGALRSGKYARAVPAISMKRRPFSSSKA